ncbi:DUF4131 domain-containing protein [Flavobacterium sp. 3HN19-14]|uniref:ComEC/Rec2 family competence protein n=1 Tax=Flavobacterium sp. 3HN19-14 TaxID=3448133 RepID=UPI003EE27D6D
MGILLAYYTSLPSKLGIGSVGILGCLFIGSYFLISKRRSLIFGLISVLLSCSIGICTWIAHDETLKKNHYINQLPNDDDEHDIEISLVEKLKSSAYKFRYVASVKAIDHKAVFGKIVLNLERYGNYNELAIGSNLLIHGKIVKNKRPDNPDQFDYGKYLDNKSIPAQLYAKTIRISTAADKNMFYYAGKIRDRVLINLRKNNFNETELNLVMALILGQQQEISPEILHDYQFAGAVHVLSVFGFAYRLYIDVYQFSAEAFTEE